MAGMPYPPKRRQVHPLKFVDINRHANLECYAVGERRIEIVVLRTIVEEVVKSGGYAHRLAYTLRERELPEGVGRIFHLHRTLGHVVVVLELYVLRARKQASVERSVYAVALRELMVVVDVGVQSMGSCRYVLVIYGVAVLVLRQALLGVSVAESCRDAVLPACLHANVCAEHSVVGEVGIGQIGQLVFYLLEIGR